MKYFRNSTRIHWRASARPNPSPVHDLIAVDIDDSRVPHMASAGFGGVAAGKLMRAALVDAATIQIVLRKMTDSDGEH